MWEEITRKEWEEKDEYYEENFKCDVHLFTVSEPLREVLFEDTGKPFDKERPFLMVVKEWKGSNGEIASDKRFFKYYEWRQP